MRKLLFFPGFSPKKVQNSERIPASKQCQGQRAEGRQREKVGLIQPLKAVPDPKPFGKASNSS